MALTQGHLESWLDELIVEMGLPQFVVKGILTAYP